MVRYLVFQLVWKDNRLDESLSELKAFMASGVCQLCPADTQRAVDESNLLTTFRELVGQNFGDHGLGQALASLQG